MKFLNIFLSLFFSFSFSYAALNICPGDKLNNLDGATATKAQTKSGIINGNTTNYYYFTPKVDGVIQVSSSMTSGYSNSLFIKKGCSTILYKNENDSDDKSSPDIAVKAGEQIVISYERRYSSSKSFSLDFIFKYVDYTFSNNQRDFTIRNPVETRNIKGNIKVIGNTVLCYKKNGKCADTNKANNRVSLSFIDTNSVNHAYNNSSQAKIAGIPSTAKIKWAGFYTQGYLKTTQANTINALTTTPTYLTTPQGETISLKNDAIDLNPYDSGEYTYATFTEVEALKGKSGSEVNGWFTGANIKALEGNDPGALGYFGAWTLVLVYEDDTETLKNISVYDGYKEIGGSNDFIKVDGFYTPTSGDVKSTLSVFVGEGDKNIVGDDITLNGVSLSTGWPKNAFNSTVNGFITNPDPINYQGIDIHNYDVGKDGDSSHKQIVGNGAKSATIGLTTTGDYYFPSMVAFTTELYEPRVCYVQNFYDENGNELTDPKVGDIITIDTWISNMKKDAEDGDLETADKVEITVELDDENIEYEKTSTEIKNIGKSEYEIQSDTQNLDLGDFIENDNTSKWRIGTGANNADGGKLLPNATGAENKKVFVRFKTKLKKTGDISINNLYKVSYENSQLGVRFGDENPLNIGICADFDTGLNVGSVGAFNVVNQNFNKSTNSEDLEAEENALHTQVANKEFTVKLISLDLNEKPNKLVPYNGEVKVKIAGGTSDNYQTVNFKDEKFKELKFTYPKAEKNLYFEIIYEGGKTTSRDSKGFAVRPDRFELSFGGNTKVAGKDYDLIIKALDYNGANTNNYNENVKLFTFKDVKGCVEGNFSPVLVNTNFKFSNGIAVLNNIDYSEAGEVEITIKEPADNEFAKDDIPHTKDPTRRISSAIEKFTFLPSFFDINTTLHQPKGNYVYLNSFGGVDSNMTAKFEIEISAKNDKGGLVENYTDSCYAKNTEFAFAFEDLDISPNDSIEEMIFFEKTSNKNGKVNVTDSDLTIKNIPKSIFKDGNTNATLDLKINFDRKTDVATNPFRLVSKSYSVEDEDNVRGVLTTNDHKATFYYGRVHAPDYRGASPITAEIGYEVYCEDCNKTDFNITNSQSPSNPNWFFNTRHDDLTNGKTDSFVSIDGTVLDKIESLNIANGSEDLILSALDTPHVDRIVMTPNPWLVFDPFNAGATTSDFIVEFSGSGEWAGEGTVDKDKADTIGEHLSEDGNSKRTNRRISW